jgi:hypothetical protein
LGRDGLGCWSSHVGASLLLAASCGFFYTYILVLLGSLLVEAADYGWASSFTCMSKKQHLREDSNEQLQCKVNSMM